MGFEKAVKEKSKARIFIDGPSGSGKTWTGLTIATAIAEKIGGRIALIDSESGSASKYADRFDFDVETFSGNFAPKKYVDSIRMAHAGGYSVVVIDSLTHAWNGTGGVLEMVDAAKSQFGGNSQRAWSVGTPAWQSIIDAMLQTDIHVIATARSKTKTVEVERNGRKAYEKQGMDVVAREGIEYEFDVVIDMDLQHTGVISKSRAGDALNPVYQMPGLELGYAIYDWLQDGTEVKEEPKEEAHIDPAKKAQQGVVKARWAEIKLSYGDDDAKAIAALKEKFGDDFKSTDLLDAETWKNVQALIAAPASDDG